ncbi:aspartate carbamoyltransferase [Candidatus Saccharibacteria bacterium]|nr:aspartate carbamoyltransferase [Candidatus Saccharibacteria bacterium]
MAVVCNAMHILSADQFTKKQLEELFALTDSIRAQFQNDKLTLLQRHAGKILITLFYEPSTRTRLSFAAAAAHMGMNVISTENAREFSSAAKGETIEDTARVLAEYYPDVIVIRHHETGEVARAAAVSSVPIINAGDGKGEHPTQSLLDAYTIWDHHKKLSNLRIVIGGDLLHGRTARSLCKVLACFSGNHIVFNTIPELQMADDIKEYLTEHSVTFEEQSDMKLAFAGADVVYWTRLQKERLPEGVNITQTFSINNKAMRYLPESAIVLHPLPRVDEIDVEVDKDPRAKYFEQAGNGMFVRMALLDQILGE